MRAAPCVSAEFKKALQNKEPTQASDSSAETKKMPFIVSSPSTIQPEAAEQD